VAQEIVPASSRSDPYTHIYMRSLLLLIGMRTYEQCNCAYLYLSTKQLNLNLDEPVASMCVLPPDPLQIKALPFLLRPCVYVCTLASIFISH
jgi:hypothetical protein